MPCFSNATLSPSTLRLLACAELFILFAACRLFCLQRADFFVCSVRIYFVCSVRIFLFEARIYFVCSVRIFLFVACGLFYWQRADLFCSQCADLFSLQCILFCEMCNFLLYGGILPGKMCPLWASVLPNPEILKWVHTARFRARQL